MDAFEGPLNIARLISLHLTGEISGDEKAALDRWISGSERNALLFRQITDPASLTAVLQELQQTDTETALAQIKSRAAEDQPARRFILLRRIAVAASLLLAISVGGYFALHKTATRVALQPGTFVNDVLPGNKAFLTLSNGQQIAVSNLPPGRIAQTDIDKSDDGSIIVGSAGSTAQAYNTFTVPRGGGRHALVLADGSLAMLDAGSSIRFPVSFPGEERVVEITGQVYFEVKHIASKPFRVHVNGTTIEDLGTRFNIKAFGAAVKTTLLEGAVSVSGVRLQPGQQAVQTPGGRVQVAGTTDLEAVMAWKNDLFKFGDNSTLSSILEELSRWYGLEIMYKQNGKGKSNHYHFSGYLSRRSKLSDILKILQSSGAQFSIDGNKLFVYP